MSQLLLHETDHELEDHDRGLVFDLTSIELATNEVNKIATSQIALPKDACDAVYAADGYSQSVSNMTQVSLNADNVFGEDGGAQQLGTVSGNVADGYTVALTVPVNA